MSVKKKISNFFKRAEEVERTLQSGEEIEICLNEENGKLCISKYVPYLEGSFPIEDGFSSDNVPFEPVIAECDKRGWAYVL